MHFKSMEYKGEILSFQCFYEYNRGMELWSGGVYLIEGFPFVGIIDKHVISKRRICDKERKLWFSVKYETCIIIEN